MPVGFSAYSFVNIGCSIVGPSGAFSLGNEAGTAEGGVSIEMVEDKATMTIGADGSPMHSLHAGQGGTVTVRLLKVSSTNALLSAMYALDTAVPGNYGRNTIVITDFSRGDAITCMFCGFRRQPANTWAKDGNVIEWVFNAGYIFETLGAGDTVLS